MRILLLSFLCMGTLGAAVVENAPGYNAWPMIQAVDGKLICTYSRGSGHSIGEGRRDAFARVSADGGQTWGDEVAVSANPNEGEVMIGKGLDSSGAALFWVRCLGKTKHHDLYRTADGVTFEKIASPAFDPFPMQVTDIVKVKRGLLCLWFQTNYKKDGKSSWGTLESADDGRTWTQKTIEKDLDLPELPTEPSFVNLGDGRLLGVARTEIAGEKGGRQFQLTSTDEGLTWQKAKTNIGDIRISTPSLVYDRATGLVHNYYYERGKGKVKRRIVQADAIFARPSEWPEPTVVATGREERPHDAGNVNVTVVGTTHYLAYYYGTQTDAAVYVEPVPSCANLLAETRRVGSERPKIAVFGGSFSCIKPSEVAKRAWSEALDCDVENFGMGGMGFLRGAEKTNDIPNQVRKALATRNRYAAFVLWASTNDLRYPVEEQNASISNCVRLIREGSPESKVLFFASMPWPLNPDNDAKLARLVDGQLETCRQLNVPCLDLYHDSGITAENAVHYTAADKHHPNAAGYAKVAPLQVRFLEAHLPTMAWSYRYTDESPKPIDLQAQIDAVAAQGGGRVDVPKGRWLTDPIELKSHVELHLSAGCELFFTDELEKYLPAVRTTYEGVECLNYRPLISAYGATQIAITGRGKIEPQMGRWETWRWNGPGTQQAKATLNEWGNRDVPVEERNLTKLPGAKTRPPFVEFNGCTDIRLEGFTLRNSPFWCIHLLDCDRAAVRGLSVSAFMNNSDGIDIECSRNVTVEDCSFDQGDDVIVLKSGKDRDGRRRATPTENVTIRRCRAGSGHGFLVAGSECSGGIRNVTMEDCRVDGSLASLFKVKTAPTRGGFIENLTMRHVTARTILDAVVDIKANYELNQSAGEAEEVLTEICGLTLEDVAVGTANIRCDIQGDARCPIRGVRLENVSVGRCTHADSIVHAEVVEK